MSGTRLQSGYSPKQEAIRIVIHQIDGAMRDVGAFQDQRLGMAQQEGIHKELVLIRERLNSRLPDHLRIDKP